MQQKSFGETEHSGVDTNAHGERQDGNQGCQPLLPQHSPAVADVLPNRAHSPRRQAPTSAS